MNEQQLSILKSCLKMIEIETVAMIASMSKKIKQMIFCYLTDFTLGPEHPNNQS